MDRNYSFTQKKYLLGTHYVPSRQLGTEDLSKMNSDTAAALQELRFLMWKARIKLAIPARFLEFKSQREAASYSPHLSAVV